MKYINKAKLTVKVKSLAAESRILKDEINKVMKNGKYAGSLQDHMLTVVNPELRATGLAMAYIRGVAYKVVEPSRKPEKEYHFQYCTVRVLLRILKKYHDKDIELKDVQDWLNK